MSEKKTLTKEEYELLVELKKDAMKNDVTSMNEKMDNYIINQMKQKKIKHFQGFHCFMRKITNGTDIFNDAKFLMFKYTKDFYTEFDYLPISIMSFVSTKTDHYLIFRYENMYHSCDTFNWTQEYFNKNGFKTDNYFVKSAELIFMPEDFTTESKLLTSILDKYDGTNIDMGDFNAIFESLELCKKIRLDELDNKDIDDLRIDEALKFEQDIADRCVKYV